MFIFKVVLFTFLYEGIVWATQVHSQPEGLYGHQLAHIFFIVSMIILMYWLRIMNLVQYRGWRYINYSALFFVFWNIDAMIVHFLDGTDGIFLIDKHGWEGSITIHAGSKAEAILYYIAKLDHIFCVPAIIFLYFGLRALTQQMSGNSTAKGVQK